MKILEEYDYYQKIIKVLLEIKEAYPEYTLGKHLQNSLKEHSGYMWKKTDKHIYNSIITYKEKLMSNTPYVKTSEIDKIIREGMNLDTILDDDEEED